MISNQWFFRIKNKPKSMQRFEKRSQKWDITFMEMRGIENDNTLGAQVSSQGQLSVLSQHRLIECTLGQYFTIT